MKKARYWLKIFFSALIIIFGIIGIASSVWMYPRIFESSALAYEKKGVGPNETIYINFSFPVRVEDYENKIKIMPFEEADFSWRDEDKRLAITPRKFWKPEKTYYITLSEGRSAAFTKISGVTTKFSTTEYPKVVDFTPKNGEKDLILDIEDPIIINFDKSTKDFPVKFDIIPESDVYYRSNVEKTSFRIIPKEKLGTEENGGKKYDVQVSIKYINDDNSDYKKIYQSSFETLPPPPEEWADDFTKRLEQARKFTRPKITEGKYIDVSIETQILSTFEDGKLLDSYLISSGKSGWTPTGSFKILNKHPRAWSGAYGLYMPYWMAFAGGGKYGLHELPEWPGGYKEGENHLGTPVSHGCVRLGIGPAKIVYEWADVGTPVEIY